MTQKKVSIFMGGTGANSAAEARDALGVLANTGGTITGNLNVANTLFVSGNVAFGTNTPYTASGHTYLTIDNAINGGGLVLQRNSSPAFLATVDATSVYLDSPTSLPIRFFIGVTEAARIESNGNVGIGVTSPETKLDINGVVRFRNGTLTGSGFVEMASVSGVGLTMQSFSYVFKNSTNTAELLRITSAGNVGIGGITNPLAPIHVFKSNTSGSQTIVLGVCSDSQRPVIQFSESADVNFGTGMGIEYDGRGVGGTNAIRFNSVDNVPVQTFMSNGWVGFGNTSPTAPLFVQHTNLPGEPYSGIYIKNTDTTGAAITGVTADGALQSHYRFALNGSLKWQWRTGAGAGIDDLRAYSFTLTDDIMILTAAGNVGIRTTSPSSSFPLTIQRSAGSSGALLLRGDNNVVGLPNIRFENTNGGANASISFDGSGFSFSDKTISNFEIFGYGNNIIRPISGDYGGFFFKTFDNSNAGYFLVRDGSDNDVYQQYGVTIVTDRGPLTLAARGATIGDNSDRNFIRFMTAGGVGSAQVRMTINKSGQITTPAQPAFYAYGVSEDRYLSGSTWIFPSTRVNRGGHYNTSNGRFTAPVSGVYFFSWGNIGGNTDNVWRYFIRVNNAQVGDIHARLDTSASGSDYGPGVNRTAILSLNAGDYVTIHFTSDAGTASYPGTNDASNDYPNFSGFLLG